MYNLHNGQYEDPNNIVPTHAINIHLSRNTYSAFCSYLTINR